MSQNRQYELIYVVSSDATDQQITDLHTQVEEIVARFSGTLDRTDNWGRRKLAYEIGPHKEGTYVLEVITGSGELMKEIDRRLRVSDQVIRHLTVRVDEENRVIERARTHLWKPLLHEVAGGAAMNGKKGVGGRGKGGAAQQGKDGQRRPMFRRRKVCKFCADKIDDINYKDVKLLGPFVPERGKILPRRISGTCATHQRKLQTAIKRARQLALLPYVTE